MEEQSGNGELISQTEALKLVENQVTSLGVTVLKHGFDTPGASQVGADDVLPWDKVHAKSVLNAPHEFSRRAAA
jgi:hypothetical protein